MIYDLLKQSGSKLREHEWKLERPKNSYCKDKH